MTKLISSALALTMAFAAASGVAAGATSHDEHHPPHKMFMFGENEVFASHIVYTKPHNFQVILKLRLDAAAQEKYLSERRRHPKDDFIYILDAMDIGQIRSAERIAGTVFRQDENGLRSDLFQLELAKGGFDILYFSELPSSLDEEPATPQN